MIAVISDVHFPSDQARQKKFEKGLQKLSGIKALFVCGDFTDNRKDTKEEEMMKLPGYLKDLPYPVFYIDGNHEDYEVLKRLPKIGETEKEALLQYDCIIETQSTKKAADGVYYLERGSVCAADGCRILAIGGSTTGPGYRKNHPDIWQPDEDLTQQDQEKIKEALRKNQAAFDLILTHTLPIDRLKEWFPEKDVSVTNEILQDVWEESSYQHWLFGHFHEDMDYPDGNFHCLYEDAMLIEKSDDGSIRIERKRL